MVSGFAMLGLSEVLWDNMAPAEEHGSLRGPEDISCVAKPEIGYTSTLVAMRVCSCKIGTARHNVNS